MRHDDNLLAHLEIEVHPTWSYQPLFPTGRRAWYSTHTKVDRLEPSSADQDASRKVRSMRIKAWAESRDQHGYGRITKPATGEPIEWLMEDEDGVGLVSTNHPALTRTPPSSRSRGTMGS